MLTEKISRRENESWQALPDRAAVKIGRHLDTKSVIRAQLACTAWRDLFIGCDDIAHRLGRATLGRLVAAPNMPQACVWQKEVTVAAAGHALMESRKPLFPVVASWSVFDSRRLIDTSLCDWRAPPPSAERCSTPRRVTNSVNQRSFLSGKGHLTDHGAGIMLLYSPDGANCRLFDATIGGCEDLSLELQPWRVAFSTNDRFLALLGQDGTVNVFTSGRESFLRDRTRIFDAMMVPGRGGGRRRASDSRTQTRTCSLA